MIKIKCQGLETVISWEELRILLDQSTLPWFKDDTGIYVVGWEEHLELRWSR